MANYLLLAAAAFCAGMMNALAGGGSFLTFPALVYCGVPSIVANASSTVALFPGAFASAWGYRHDYVPLNGVKLRTALAVGIVGGITGAILLLVTPQRSFDAIIPWLLLVATLLFGFGRQLIPRLQRVFTIGPAALLVILFLVGIYAGYFGGAAGILMLAVLGLFGLTDINAMNAGKSLIVGTMNAFAVICFVIAGKIWWGETAVMLVAAVLGGYSGARFGRRINPTYQRIGITGVGILMTVWFFLRR